MSTHPSSPGQVAAESVKELYLLFGSQGHVDRPDYLRLFTEACQAGIDSASLPAAGEEWTVQVSDAGLGRLMAGDKFIASSGAQMLVEIARAHNAALRRSQPVQGLEQIARKATKSAWRSVNRRIISFDSFKASVEPFILRACQDAASQAKL